MKVRLGFVSNSSSSSFIIAVRKEKSLNHDCPTCGRKGVNVLKLFKEQDPYGCDSTGVECTGSEEILEHYEDDWYKENKKLQKVLQDIKKGVYNDREVALVRVSYNDEIYRDLLDDKSVEILYDFEG